MHVVYFKLYYDLKYFTTKVVKHSDLKQTSLRVGASSNCNVMSSSCYCAIFQQTFSCQLPGFMLHFTLRFSGNAGPGSTSLLHYAHSSVMMHHQQVMPSRSVRAPPEGAGHFVCTDSTDISWQHKTFAILLVRTKNMHSLHVVETFHSEMIISLLPQYPPPSVS